MKIAEISTPKMAFKVLLTLNFSLPKAQQIIDKKRLFYGKNGEILVQNKNELICGEIFLIDYECKPKGIKPIFECDEFAVFDKQSGILSHPNGRNSVYNLYDEIWHLYGKNASVAHRLDKETSGVILVCKNSKISREFKIMFENHLIKKEYFALVKDEISRNFIVDKAICKGEISSEITIRMKIDENGKNALTSFEVVKFYPQFNATLLKIQPFTGRQHQIRLHLFHVKHSIFGEPLYGQKREIVEAIMDKKLNDDERIFYTGAKRLCLHASKLEFMYQNRKFIIKTKCDFESEFLQSLKSG